MVGCCDAVHAGCFVTCEGVERGGVFDTSDSAVWVGCESTWTHGEFISGGGVFAIAGGGRRHTRCNGWGRLGGVGMVSCEESRAENRIKVIMR